MPQQVAGTAVTTCIFSLGGAPSVFNPTPRPVLSSSLINGVITDNIPFTNIVPFAMCCSPSNPAFVAATSAALGVPTPVPCTPVTPAPWAPGVPNVLITNIPVLDNTCKLTCALGGMISITFPAQITHNVP
ncbi:MAG: DUF4280 domain-containing protein [Ideonella sp.]|jgi:hypothetical protein|nr:DUF4280 domain-containing protein [Ideonella sp.]MBL0147845.1 DUF4280 domain-containing protein [Ideonella sp.]